MPGQPVLLSAHMSRPSKQPMRPPSRPASSTGGDSADGGSRPRSEGSGVRAGSQPNAWQALDALEALEAAAATSSGDFEEPQGLHGLPKLPDLPDMEAPRSSRGKKLPDVEVSASTRVVLLTWARWGRNSLRLAKEQDFKAMQHVRYPRNRAPVPWEILSPQPTPREGGTPREQAPAAPPAAAPVSALRRPVATKARVPRGALNSRGNQMPERASLFDELAKEQRTSMDEQGVRLKLGRGLGAEASVANSSATPGFGSATPGFGVDTPNFVGAKSRGGSTLSSAGVSAVSSGVCSPVGKRGTGMMSPWLMEAQVMIGGEESKLGQDIVGKSAEAGRSHAWGFSPAIFEEEEELEDDDLPLSSVRWPPLEPLSACFEDEAPLTPERPPKPSRPAPVPFPNAIPRSPTRTDSDKPVLDEDELNQVGMFQPSPEKERRGPASPAKPEREIPKLATATANAARGCSPSGGAREGASARGASPSGGARGGGSARGRRHAPGDIVKYWSESKRVWLPARIVEAKAGNIYLVDKQMKGCYSKVRGCEIMSSTEERKDHWLRALSALEGFQDNEGDKEPQDDRGGRAISPFSPSPCRPGGGSADRPSSGRSGRNAPSRPTSGFGSPGSNTSYSQGCSPGSSIVKTRAAEAKKPGISAMSTTATSPASTFGSNTNGGLRPSAPTPRRAARGRVIRTDFSDDESSSEGG
eukprot:gnl/TRDRNA2_/TRDRNA2_185411_c0_seq1.p1 gnl/TRDRNA2_/TRDRNA2_185411_c0~~gnl/TRDRNA2_/TRDRNA2_185411_c0_seq1.p1  ORF type:complete len:816 (-),score=145.44 gnl/TRDRNA2_/TRDRNA2_185411_c0_seq1:29-2125(-)